MSIDAPPIGRPEGHTLELKGREALKDRPSIAREVVGMLNADGGDVWIGVAERDGKAVELEPVVKAEHEKQALMDFLIDVIEPPLSHEEVRVETVGKVLRIRVQPDPKHVPYSFKGRGGALYFPVRIGNRLRPMTRDEQRSAFAREPKQADGLQVAIQRMLEERVELQRQAGHRLSMRVKPVPAISLSGRQDAILELLQDPELTGSRRSAWVYGNPYVPPERHSDGRVTSRWPPSSYESDEWFRTEVHLDGTILYEAGLRRYSLERLGQQKQADAPPELWPLAIAELPVSMLRLAGTLLEGHLEEDGKVIADLSLFGLRGWQLRPGSPRFLGHRVLWDFPEAATFEGQDLLLSEPLVFDWRDVRENPDRCGYRLVAQVYREFGYGAEAISLDVFDPSTGRLQLAS